MTTEEKPEPKRRNQRSTRPSTKRSHKWPVKPEEYIYISSDDESDLARDKNPAKAKVKLETGGYISSGSYQVSSNDNDWGEALPAGIHEDMQKMALETRACSAALQNGTQTLNAIAQQSRRKSASSSTYIRLTCRSHRLPRPTMRTTAVLWKL